MTLRPTDDGPAFDRAWDRADFTMDKHYKEMDDYIARCQAAGLPKTKEEAARRHKEFEEIQSRMNRCAVELMKRVRSGDQAPHLRKVE